MNAAVSILFLAAVLGVIVFLLSRRESGRRSQYGPAGLSEFRTDLPSSRWTPFIPCGWTPAARPW